MSMSQITLDYLVANVDSRYDCSVSLSIINQHGGNPEIMSNSEYEQLIDDLISIVNDRD